MQERISVRRHSGSNPAGRGRARNSRTERCAHRLRRRRRLGELHAAHRSRATADRILARASRPDVARARAHLCWPPENAAGQHRRHACRSFSRKPRISRIAPMSPRCWCIGGARRQGVGAALLAAAESAARDARQDPAGARHGKRRRRAPVCKARLAALRRHSGLRAAAGRRYCAIRRSSTGRCCRVDNERADHRRTRRSASMHLGDCCPGLPGPRRWTAR